MPAACRKEAFESTADVAVLRMRTHFGGEPVGETQAVYDKSRKLELGELRLRRGFRVNQCALIRHGASGLHFAPAERDGVTGIPLSKLIKPVGAPGFLRVL